MPRNRKHPSPVPRRDFLKMSAATVGAIGAVGVAPAEAAAGRQSAAGPAAGRPSTKTPRRGGDVQVQRRVRRRAAQPRGVSHGRHGRGHDLPGRHRRAVARLAAQPAGGVQRAAAPSPRSRVKGKTQRRARAGRAGAGLEALRRAGHGQRRRRHVVRPAAVPPGHVPARAFPFGAVTLARSRTCRSSVEITGWSPFEPGDADNSSLPVAALEYRFTNPTGTARSRRCSPGTRRTSWPSARTRRR